LEILYGKEAELHLRAVEEGGVGVIVTLPFRET
jgi:hypothetical protein